MNDTTSSNEIIEREISPDSSMVALLNKSEIDMQIATAHKYPRSITAFRKEVYELVTLSEAVADECFYALPRDGKMIEGPSARFAEIIGSCWGNSRVGARVVADKGDFIVSQGVFHDLQRNWLVTFEVERRVTGKNNKRYSADMIGVTGNAASSIAMRNAVLKGIPKALWSDLYESARKTAAGDVKTLPTRRATLFEALLKMGVPAEAVFKKLGVGGMDDIGLDEITTLKGMMTAIREGDTTIEQAFAADQTAAEETAKPVPKSKTESVNAAAQATTDQRVKPATSAAMQQATVAMAPVETAVNAGNRTVEPVAAAPSVPVEDGGLTPEEQARWAAEVQGSPAKPAAQGKAIAGRADSGELSSAGEQQWLKKRAGTGLADLLVRHGVPALEAMTRVQFDAMRAELV